MKTWDEFFGPLRLRLELIKENSEYRKLYKETSREEFAKNCIRFGINLAQVTARDFLPHGHTVDEIFGYLDPEVEGDGDGYDQFVCALFCDHPIRQPTVDDFPVDENGRVRMAVKPSERVLVVDLARKDEDLLEAFKKLLRTRRDDKKWAAEAAKAGEPYPGAENFAQWDIDPSRDRTEKGWQHLRVWKLRHERKGFPEIARAMGMNLSTVKMAFYKAHEMIEGCPYDRDRYKRYGWGLRQCATCPDNSDRGGTCMELYPDMLEFVGKGVTPLRSRGKAHDQGPTL